MSLGKTFEQVVDIRTSPSYVDHYVHFDFETASTDLSTRQRPSTDRKKSQFHHHVFSRSTDPNSGESF
jgi:hypothetical protein